MGHGGEEGGRGLRDQGAGLEDVGEEGVQELLIVGAAESGL